MQNPNWLLCLVIVNISDKGWGLYALHNTLYIIITSIVTKLVGHRCLMWEEINYRITRRRAESGMGAQPLFLIFFFGFIIFSFFGTFYLSLLVFHVFFYNSLFLLFLFRCNGVILSVSVGQYITWINSKEIFQKCIWQNISEDFEHFCDPPKEVVSHWVVSNLVALSRK